MTLRDKSFPASLAIDSGTPVACTCSSQLRLRGRVEFGFAGVGAKELGHVWAAKPPATMLKRSGRSALVKADLPGDGATTQEPEFIGALRQLLGNNSDLFVHHVAAHARKGRPRSSVVAHYPQGTKITVIVVVDDAHEGRDNNRLQPNSARRTPPWTHPPGWLFDMAMLVALSLFYVELARRRIRLKAR